MPIVDQIFAQCTCPLPVRKMHGIIREQIIWRVCKDQHGFIVYGKLIHIRQTFVSHKQDTGCLLRFHTRHFVLFIRYHLQMKGIPLACQTILNPDNHLHPKAVILRIMPWKDQ